MTRTSESGGRLNGLILNPHIDKTITSLLTDAAKTATSYNQVEFLIRENSSPSDNELRPFLFAFGYVLRPREEMADDLGPYSPSFTSRDESGDAVRFPPPLSEINDDDVSAWASEIDGSEHPLLVARLGDLLWLRKFGSKPHLYGSPPFRTTL